MYLLKGIDIPDVEIVVVNGVPNSMLQLYQVYVYINCCVPISINLYHCTSVVWSCWAKWESSKSSPSVQRYTEEI